MRGIGSYRHLFTLEAPTRTGNGAGGSTTSWATVDTVKGTLADFDPEPERSTEGRVHGVRKGVIEIRYRKAVTTAMRLTLGSRTFQIVGVPGLDESRQTGRQRLRCEEKVG